MLSGKIKLLYNDEILDEYFEFLLRSKTLEVFQRNTRKHTLSDKTFILFLIAQPRHSTSGKPSVHIRHFHGSKNEQILIFQNRFQLIVNTHSRNAFVRLQEQHLGINNNVSPTSSSCRANCSTLAESFMSKFTIQSISNLRKVYLCKFSTFSQALKISS